MATGAGVPIVTCHSPSLNLGRRKQGTAIRTAGTDSRVARLRCESEMTVELMTVPSILDNESRCTTKRAIDKGTRSFPVSIVCRVVECCGSKNDVQRKNNTHAISA